MRLVIMFLMLAFCNVIEALQGDNTEFVVDIALSSQQLAIDDLLTVTAILTFPNTYHPNIDQMRSGIVAYGGIDDSPFVLMKSSAQPVQNKEGKSTQKIDFILSPQIPGDHFLTFQMVRFDSNANDAAVEVPSDIFSVGVIIPEGNFQFNHVISGPLPLSQQLPITISEQNQRKYLQNAILESKERLRVMTVLQGTSFPWLSWLSAVVVLFVIVLIWMLPEVEGPSEDDKIAIERVRQAALEELRKLVLMSPDTDETASAFFLRLDNALRDYLDTSYHFGAAALTSQELARKMTSSFDKELCSGLIGIFQTADNIKFAHRDVSRQDCLKAIQTLKSMLS